MGIGPTVKAAAAAKYSFSANNQSSSSAEKIGKGRVNQRGVNEMRQPSVNGLLEPKININRDSISRLTTKLIVRGMIILMAFNAIQK